MSPKRFDCAAFALVLVSGILLTAARLATPEDLMCADQERPASYVLDALRNGHWLCQIDWMGDVTSKPPLYTWLAAAAALPFGHINRFLLVLPSIASVLVLALIILRVGDRRFGAPAGLLGALAFLLSPLTAWVVAVARTDDLFALTVTMTALLAFSAWIAGRGWIWFWLAAAAATMTKGPLGMLLGGIGLAAAYWEKRNGKPLPLRGQHWTGIALYLAITLGWFGLSCAEMGRSVVSRMIGEELVGSVHTGGSGLFSIKHFFVPFLYILGRFAPWSVFACVALWRIVKHPASDENERRFERFLLCWFAGGVVVFSLPAHQRAALLFPLIPPTAWLAGREMARLLRKRQPAALLKIAGVGALCVLGLITFYYQKYRGDDRQIEQTAIMQQAAGFIRQQGGEDFPIVHVDTPFALQYFLNTMNPLVSPKQAARLLSRSNAVFVAVCDRRAVDESLDKSHPAVFELLRCPPDGPARVVILSNHPRLERTAAMAAAFGPISVWWDRVRLAERRGHNYVFEASEPGASLQFSNDSALTQAVCVRLRRAGGGRTITRELAPNEVWRVFTGVP